MEKTKIENYLEEIDKNSSCKERVNERLIIVKKMFAEQRYADALFLLDQSLTISTENDLKDELSRVNEYLAIYYFNNGDLKKAQTHFLKAIEDDNSHHLDRAANCYNGLGSIDCRLGNYDSALNYLFTANELCKKTGNERDLANVLNNISLTFNRLNRLEDSLSYSQSALAIRKKIDNEKGIANTYMNIGAIYYSMNKQSRAVSYIKKALRIYEKLDLKKSIAACCNNIATTFFKMEHNDICERYLNKAIDVQNSMDTTSTLARSYLLLAKLNFAKEKNDIAVWYCDLAKSIAETIKEVDLLLEVHSLLTTIYESVGDYKNAFLSSKTEQEFIKNSFNDKMVKEIAELQTKFNFEQKVKETEILQSKNKELAQFNAVIEAQKLELEEVNHSKDHILNVVSHDLKTHLSSIKQAVDLMQAKMSVYDDLNKYAFIIDKTTEKTVLLVNDLLESSRLDTKDFRLVLIPANICTLVESYEDTFKIMAEKKQLSLTIKTNSDPIIVALNCDRFWQIMNNIVNNAVKFTRKQGNITISVYNKNNFGVVEIKDDGIGIPKEKMNQIFDRFSTASRKGTENEASTGLGLSIAKRLMELHNGKIDVSSEVNKGTTFQLYFPLQ